MPFTDRCGASAQERTLVPDLAVSLSPGTEVAAELYAARIVETVRQPLLLLSSDLRVVTANCSFYTAFGGSPASVQGKPLSEIGEGAWDHVGLRSGLDEVLPGDRELRDFELTHTAAHGGTRTLLLNARQLQQAEGAVRMVLLSIEDVTEQRGLSSQLADAMRELELRNRELQDFASVASHDLQEPLRKIQAFSGRLATVCGDVLPAEGRDYLSRIQNAAGRMSSLIHDLLSLTRVMTRGQTFRQVDLRAVTTAVLTDIEEAIARVGATVTIGAMASVNADPTQMRQLLQNLIGNAIKFHGSDPCVIKVSCEPTPDGCLLAVDDNGIGFDNQYAERIFDPFQRLHPRGQFEGTGVGLALCRRIMERHGGSIRAESLGDGGARFVAFFPETQTS